MRAKKLEDRINVVPITFCGFCISAVAQYSRILYTSSCKFTDNVPIHIIYII